ncbi:uncharacterized protein LOC109708777 [Ananas comosus]|uniref:Uncharacterized protein LOC109708777 n=1 Tax=Ananas comosus TaxID=4615 RepID=A0A6P5EYB7_ANACO|nr:uncharacterized protein LOC109708777 [Ananas comosus]
MALPKTPLPKLVSLLLLLLSPLFSSSSSSSRSYSDLTPDEFRAARLRLAPGLASVAAPHRGSPRVLEPYEEAELLARECDLSGGDSGAKVLAVEDATSPTSRSPSKSYSPAMEMRASKKSLRRRWDAGSWRQRQWSVARRSREGGIRQQQRRGWQQRRGRRPRHRVGCGPLATTAAERGAVERRRWDVAAPAARVEGSGGDPGAVGSDGDEEGERERERGDGGAAKGSVAVSPNLNSMELVEVHGKYDQIFAESEGQPFGAESKII